MCIYVDAQSACQWVHVHFQVTVDDTSMHNCTFMYDVHAYMYIHTILSRFPLFPARLMREALRSGGETARELAEAFLSGPFAGDGEEEGHEESKGERGEAREKEGGSWYRRGSMEKEEEERWRPSRRASLSLGKDGAGERGGKVLKGGRQGGRASLLVEDEEGKGSGSGEKGQMGEREKGGEARVLAAEEEKVGGEDGGLEEERPRGSGGGRGEGAMVEEGEKGDRAGLFEEGEGAREEEKIVEERKVSGAEGKMGPRLSRRSEGGEKVRIPEGMEEAATRRPSKKGRTPTDIDHAQLLTSKERPARRVTDRYDLRGLASRGEFLGSFLDASPGQGKGDSSKDRGSLRKDLDRRNYSGWVGNFGPPHTRGPREQSREGAGKGEGGRTGEEGNEGGLRWRARGRPAKAGERSKVFKEEEDGE